ncbi:MAG TPA: cation diffusion facilitator family transporter [Hyphomicrobium sp.]|jgi:cobalt-zinc-cadmium efflux system protein|nr:cation diffusion facilitator family transporter [Hyphomicrobium sp.]
MGHDHSHTHGTGNLNARRLFWAGLLTAGTMLAEAIGGIYAGSLALLADAGHMLTDSAALALAWLAVRMAARPADWKRTYGFQRFEVLAAFANGLALFFISAAIAWEAVSRIFMPVEVLGGTMLAIATLGLLVNLGTLLILRTGGGANLNVRAALLHVMSDLLGSVAAILAALVILWTGWTAIDPLLSILITLLILRSAWLITKDAGHILLEGAPSGLDVREVQKDLEASIPEVQSIHDIHAWCLNEERPLMTLHARISQASPPEEIAAAIKARLKLVYGITHATIEVEHRSCSNAVPAPARGEVLKKSV